MRQRLWHLVVGGEFCRISSWGPRLWNITTYGSGGWMGVGTEWNAKNRDFLRNRQFAFMYCPSSSLPKQGLTDDEQLKGETFSGLRTQASPARRTIPRRPTWTITA